MGQIPNKKDVLEFLFDINNLQRLKKFVRRESAVFRIPEYIIRSVQKRALRMDVVDIQWKLDNELKILNAPTASYIQMVQASKKTVHCFDELYALAEMIGNDVMKNYADKIRKKSEILFGKIHDFKTNLS